MKHIQFSTMLIAEMETKIKAKKQVAVKEDLAYGSSTDDDKLIDANHDY